MLQLINLSSVRQSAAAVRENNQGGDVRARAWWWRWWLAVLAVVAVVAWLPGAARVQSAVAGFHPGAKGEVSALAEVPVRVGPEIHVSASNTFGFQWHPSVAPLPNGGSVVVWAGPDEIRWQRLDANGTPVGAAFRVGDADDLEPPTVASSPTGEFVVAWQNEVFINANNIPVTILARRYDSNGNPLGGVFQVNSAALDATHGQVAVAMLSGGFVIAWQGRGDDGNYEIFSRRYDANGAAVGGQFQVNATTAGHQARPSVVPRADGGFTVIWESENQDGSGFGIFGQHYDASANKVGTEFQINTRVSGDQTRPRAASGPNGAMVVVWQSDGQDGDDWGIYGQRYDAAGNWVGGEFRVNTTTAGIQQRPAVAFAATGDLMVAWENYYQPGELRGNMKDVFAQRYDGNGLPVGAEFRVNTYIADFQDWAAVAGVANADFQVVWNSNAQDGSGFGVYGQRFGAATEPLPTPPPIPDGAIVIEQVKHSLRFNNQFNLGVCTYCNCPSTCHWEGNGTPGEENRDEFYNRREEGESDSLDSTYLNFPFPATSQNWGADALRLHSYRNQSGAGTTTLPVQTVMPGEPFPILHFTHMNIPIRGDSPTRLRLSTAVVIRPVGEPSFELAIGVPINFLETDNNPPCDPSIQRSGVDCDDRFWIEGRPSAQITANGRIWKLEILGFRDPVSGASVPTFATQEGIESFTEIVAVLTVRQVGEPSPTPTPTPTPNPTPIPTPTPTPTPVFATITVNSTADGTLDQLNGNGTCDLREAITNANNNNRSGSTECSAGRATLDTIGFSVTGKIILTAGELAISDSLTIHGPGANRLTISGGFPTTPSSRVFNIAEGAFDVTLQDLTIADGAALGTDGNIGAQAFGGGIFNASTGTLNVINSVLYNNLARAGQTSGNSVKGGSSFGGGIYNASSGTVNITNSTLAGNSALVGTTVGDSGQGGNALGGGIYNASSGRVSITGSILFNNDAIGGDNTGSFGAGGDGLGGGIYNANNGTISLLRSTLSGNSARGGNGGSYFGGGGSGGGIMNANGMAPFTGTVNITSSTLTGNTASSGSGSLATTVSTGGAIRTLNGGAVNLTAVTISGNTVTGSNGSGGGISNNGSTVNARNTIIANGTAGIGPDVSGPLTSQGYNLIENTSGATITPAQPTDIFGVDPLLGSLANHGGPTQTLLPQMGSPVIDKGNSFDLTIDQRGSTRSVDNPNIANATGGDGTDIGAVELFSDAASQNSITLTTTNASALFDAINFANDDPAPTTINLVCGVYTLTERGDLNNYYGFNGLPVITSNITIQGNGAVIERSTAAGTPTFRLFAVAKQDPTSGVSLATPGSLTLRQVTLRGGLAQGGAGGTAAQYGGGGGGGLGGAVYNQGTLNIEQSALIQNTARGGNGGSGGTVAAISSPGGGGGGLGGNGGTTTHDPQGGSGGGGFGGNGGLGSGSGGEGGGRTADGLSVGSGGSAEGGDGSGRSGGFGGGGGGESDAVFADGGNGGIGGGGGGASRGYGVGGDGGFGGGGGGGYGGGGDGGFGGGGGGGFGTGNGLVDGGKGGYGGVSGNFTDGGGGGGLGGAIFNDTGLLTLTNSTLSGNTARGGNGGGRGLGGAVFARNGTVTINNVTINNSSVIKSGGIAEAYGGGALYLLGDGMVIRPGDPQTVTFNVSNSIMANTTPVASDVIIDTINAGTATPGTNNNNLVELNGTSVGADENDLPGVTRTADPLLGELTMANCAGGGCRTPVHTITASSPALDGAGGKAESVDQCGTARPPGPGRDIGAYELACQPITATVSGGGTIRPGQTAVVTVTLTGGTGPYTVTLTNGGTRTGASPLSFTLGPQSTTTYTVTAGTDNNDCPVTASGSATITVDGTPPTITCPGNQVGVIAGTTGPATYPAPMVNDNRPGATFSCTPASGANFPLGVTTVNCTATDAVGNTAACSFTMTVRQPRPAIKDLIAKVKALVPPLTTTQANQLIGHLEMANTSIERGQTSQACTHLQNFINAVNASVSGGRLTMAQGQALIDCANKTRAAVGCG